MLGMFFGGKKKLNLIRLLLERRMAEMGYDDYQHQLILKNMGKLELLGSPEATLISIIEMILNLQKRGMLIGHILAKIELKRSSTGSDQTQFHACIDLSRGPDPAQAIYKYCEYRLDIEHQGVVPEHIIIDQIEIATLELWRN
ncbi:hypothetical protein N8Z76_01165 [Gammaproteobacteria bacterium]|jgi:hypothetical protein|nr:hypothetical protein [Gammaproteobacteria bacterium]